MKNKRIIVITALLSAVVTFAACLCVFYLRQDALQKAWFLINDTYVNGVDADKVQEAAIEGMVTSLEDPYSMYFDEAAYQSFQDEMDSQYDGIGIEVYMKDGKMVVLAPFEDGPAAKAGILPGDIILRVGDIEVNENSYRDCVTYMRGATAASAEVQEFDVLIQRGEEQKTYHLRRDTIVRKTVETTMYDDCMHVRITGFDTPTSGEFATVLADVVKNNVRGLLIDVRDNPGGQLKTVRDIADMLLPACDIVYTVDKNGKRTTYKSDADAITQPIVLLVNENSASASEILAGALHDNDRADLVGVTTFGKGSVQSVFPLDKGALKLTIAHYYSPNGNIIDGKGVTPDYIVEDTGTEEEDVQLQRGLALLREKISR